MKARLAKARLLASIAANNLEDSNRRGMDDDLDMPEIETDYVDYKP
jgi:hypothetical protein